MPQGSPSSGHPALSTLPGDPERRAGGPGAWASPPRPCSGSPSPASHPELSLCCRWAPEGHTTRPGHVLGERASPLANRAQTAGQLHRRAPSQFPRLKARIREGAVTRDQGAHATGGASASHRGRRTAAASSRGGRSAGLGLGETHPRSSFLALDAAQAAGVPVKNRGDHAPPPARLPTPRPGAVRRLRARGRGHLPRAPQAADPPPSPDPAPDTCTCSEGRAARLTAVLECPRPSDARTSARTSARTHVGTHARAASPGRLPERGTHAVPASPPRVSRVGRNDRGERICPGRSRAPTPHQQGPERHWRGTRLATPPSPLSAGDTPGPRGTRATLSSERNGPV